MSFLDIFFVGFMRFCNVLEVLPILISFFTFWKYQNSPFYKGGVEFPDFCKKEVV